MSGISYPPPLEIVPIFDVANYIYATSSGGGLTPALAKTLFLQKTVPDTASALETFTAGVKSNYLSPLNTGDEMTIGSAGSTISINSILNVNTITTTGGSQTFMTSGINTESITASGTLTIPTIATSGSNPTNMTSGITTTTINASSSVTAGSLNVGNVNQTSGTIASQNIVCTNLRGIAFRDSGNNLGNNGQYLKTTGALCQWANITSPSPTLTVYIPLAGLPITASVATGTVRATVIAIGGGGTQGTSTVSGSTTYISGCGGGGGCAIVYDIFMSPAQRFTITNSGPSTLVQLSSTGGALYYTGGASNTYPLTLCNVFFGGTGANGTLAGVGTGGGLGGTATGNTIYPTSILSGTNGMPITSAAQANLVQNLGGGNLLPTGIVRNNTSYGDYALGVSLTKLSGTTSVTAIPAGTGAVLIYAYAY